MSESVHTIPVPPGWTVEQAWETISRGERLPTNYPEHEAGWATIAVRNFTAAGSYVTGGQLLRVLA